MRMIQLTVLVAATGCVSQSESDSFVRQIKDQYPELSKAAVETGVVSRVIDGDTFQLSDGTRVRMIGVDTPETVKPNSPVERFGKEASNFTKRHLNERKVYLFRDVSDKDRYGRLLRYVFVEGELQMFNERLIAEGYANVMTVPPNVTFAEKWLQTERLAREHKRGLWQEDGETAPEAALSCAEPQIKGNINSKGEKIYHVPQSRYYDQTIAEQMFCTEEEAVEAGFRKAKP